MPDATTNTVLELHHGDCLAGMRALADASVDLVVTSPPYNLDIAYRQYRDDAAARGISRWSHALGRRSAARAQTRRLLFPQCRRGARQSAAAARIDPATPASFSCCKTRSTGSSRSPSDPRRASEISAGHFKPINSPRYLTDCHEYVFHLTKSGNVPLDRLAVGVAYADKSNIARWGHTEGARPALPRQQLVHPLQDDQEPRPGPPASRHVPRRSSPSSASGSTASAPVSSCSIPSSASATPPSPPPSAASGRFIGFEIDAGLSRAKPTHDWRELFDDIRMRMRSDVEVRMRRFLRDPFVIVSSVLRGHAFRLHPMLAFILRRFASMLARAVLRRSITFFLMRLAPGGPFDRERKIPPAIEKQLLREIQSRRHALGQQYLDLPAADLAATATCGFPRNTATAR